MKFLIPAKSDSERCENKNWRPFYGRQSLVDIAIEKASRIVGPINVYVSCEDEAYAERVERQGAAFIKRDERLTSNDVPFGEVIQAMAEQVPGNDDIFLTHVTTPLFDEHAKMVELWALPSKGATCGYQTFKDSMTAVYPIINHTFDERYNPVGWSWGAWFKGSQRLPPMYQMTFCASIIKRATIRRYAEYVGPNCYYYHASGRPVDVDEPEDFEAAQILYAARISNGVRA